jgi:hypothetical protein
MWKHISPFIFDLKLIHEITDVQFTDTVQIQASVHGSYTSLPSTRRRRRRALPLDSSFGKQCRSIQFCRIFSWAVHVILIF